MKELIQCGHRKNAPWGIICVHLSDHTSAAWVRVPQEPGKDFENDWLCPECIEKFPDLSADNLRAVCIHCIRELRRGAVTSSQAEPRDMGAKDGDR